MATKDTDESKKQTAKTTPVVATPGPQTEEPVSQPVAMPAQTTQKNQAVITIAIVSGVVLFFVGLGLGYLLGHNSTTSSRSFQDNGTFQPPSDGGGRRFYPNSGTNNNTDDNGGSSGSTSTTPQTN